jgi:hypothetical protein
VRRGVVTEPDLPKVQEAPLRNVQLYLSFDRSTSVMAAFDSPNWRAIAEGFTPAFMAARMRFALAGVIVSEDRFDGGAVGAPTFSWELGSLGGFFPRLRASSLVTAAKSLANSASSRSMREASRSEGRRTRGEGFTPASCPF